MTSESGTQHESSSAICSGVIDPCSPKLRISDVESSNLWFKLCVITAGRQLSYPLRHVNPSCLNPSENPPAPQKKSIIVGDGEVLLATLNHSK